MGPWGKRKVGVRVEQGESGKLLSVKRFKKSGEPVLGVPIYWSEDRAGKLRKQARELGRMEENLEHMAEAMERKARRGKAARLFWKVFRRGAPQEGK